MRLSGLAVLLTLALAPAPALAHAFLDHAEPRVGSQVKPPPRTVQLWFTQGLAAAFCQVTVAGPPGFGGAGPARPAPGDNRRLIVDLRPPLPPGVYRVRWRALSADTHVTEGEFAFTVRP